MKKRNKTMKKRNKTMKKRNKIKKNTRKKKQKGGASREELIIQANKISLAENMKKFNEKINKLICVVEPLDLSIFNTITPKYKIKRDKILKDYNDGILLDEWENTEPYIRDKEMFAKQEETQMLPRPPWEYIYAVNKYRERFPDDIDVRNNGNYQTILKKIIRHTWGKTGMINELGSEYKGGVGRDSFDPWDSMCRQYDSKFYKNNTAKCKTTDIYLKRNLSSKKDILSCNTLLLGENGTPIEEGEKNTTTNSPIISRFFCVPHDDLFGLIPKPYIRLLYDLIEKKIEINLFSPDRYMENKENKEDAENSEEKEEVQTSKTIQLNIENVINIMDGIQGDTVDDIIKKKITFLLWTSDRMDTLKYVFDGNVNWFINNIVENEDDLNLYKEIIVDLKILIDEYINNNNSLLKEKTDKPLSFILIPWGGGYPEAILKYIQNLTRQLLRIILYNFLLIISGDKERSWKKSEEFVNDFVGVGTSFFVSKYILNGPISDSVPSLAKKLISFTYTVGKTVGYTQKMKNSKLKEKINQSWYNVVNRNPEATSFYIHWTWLMETMTIILSELADARGERLNGGNRVNFISFLKYWSKLGKLLNVPGGKNLYKFFSTIQAGYTNPVILNGNNTRLMVDAPDAVQIISKLDLGK